LAGSRRVEGFLARAGVVATIVVFLVTGLFTSLEPATYPGALILYTNPPAMDSRTERS
jgi:hypothetical protein